MTSSFANTIPASDASIPIPTDLGIKTDAQKQLYQTDLEFEKSFVSQLMQSMDEATQASDGSSDSSSGSSSDSSSSNDSLDGSNDPSVSGYNSMITDQETSAIMSGGGLGLAAVMYKATAPELGADGTGTGQGAESVAQITSGMTAPATGSADTSGSTDTSSTPGMSAAAAPVSTDATKQAMSTKSTTSVAATAAVATTATTPTATAADATTAAPTTPTTGTTTTGTTPDPDTTSSHLRGFFRDPNASTGWSFINQYGHIASNVAAPDAHNRIVNQNGETQLGWGPNADQSVQASSKHTVKTGGGTAHVASVQSTAELRGRVAATGSARHGHAVHTAKSTKKAGKAS